VGTALEPLTIRVHWTAKEPVEGPLFSFVVWSERGQAVAIPSMHPTHEPGTVYLGAGTADYHIDALSLAPGVYTITAAAHDRTAMTVFDRVDEVATLHVQPGDLPVRGMVDLAGAWRTLEGTPTDLQPVDGTGTPEAVRSDDDARVPEETA
jgi:hypothetical protein